MRSKIIKYFIFVILSGSLLWVVYISDGFFAFTIGFLPLLQTFTISKTRSLKECHVTKRDALLLVTILLMISTAVLFVHNIEVDSKVVRKALASPGVLGLAWLSCAVGGLSTFLPENSKINTEQGNRQN